MLAMNSDFTLLASWASTRAVFSASHARWRSTERRARRILAHQSGALARPYCPAQHVPTNFFRRLSADMT